MKDGRLAHGDGLSKIIITIINNYSYNYNYTILTDNQLAIHYFDNFYNDKSLW